MKVLLIEDEELAMQRLRGLLKEVHPQVEVCGEMDSVEACENWKKVNDWPDLIISDIQLADGLSFYFFDKHIPDCPVIFTTAFDQYAIKAFEVHSIDYLLKPVDKLKLEKAIKKAEKISQQNIGSQLADISKLLAARDYKERFLVNRGEELLSIHVSDIHYFYASGKHCFLKTKDREFIIEYTLEELSKMLDPKLFFKLNRQYLASHKSIEKVVKHLSSRLKIELTPVTKQEIFVSKERAGEFKDWLGR